MVAAVASVVVFVIKESRVDEIEDVAKAVVERSVDFDGLDDVILLLAFSGSAPRSTRRPTCPRNLELEERLFTVALLFRLWGLEKCGN